MAEERQKLAKKYEKIHLILDVGETVVSLFLLLGFIFLGYSLRLRETVAAWSSHPYLQLLIYIAVWGMAFSVLLFPFSFISGYWVEHKFNLSNQSLRAWLWEKLKMLAVGILLFIPIVLIFYYLLRTTPHTWWLWTALVLFFFSILIGRIAPQLIFPLFYKFEPLENDSLLQRMRRLAGIGKFRLQGVYRFNMSKTTKKANAAFTGLGKSKRIILGDTLLEKFSNDEIEVVFAHEVGHYVHKHILQGILIGTLTTFITLYLAYKAYAGSLGYFSLQGMADLAGLPVLSLILAFLGFISSPLSNILSRSRERIADRFALEHSTHPAAFISAMQKLAALNLSDKEPNALIEFLFHSHPALSKRIAMAEKYLKEKNIPIPDRIANGTEAEAATSDQGEITE